MIRVSSRTMRLITVSLAAFVLASCGGSDPDPAEERGAALVEEFESAEECPEPGDPIPEDFDGCKVGDSLQVVQSFDCADGSRLIYMDGIGHGRTGGTMEPGEWSAATVGECAP